MNPRFGLRTRYPSEYLGSFNVCLKNCPYPPVFRPESRPVHPTSDVNTEMFVADTDTLFFMEHHFIATSLQLDYAFILLMFLLETQVQNGPHHSTPHFFHMISVIVPFSPVISAVSTPWTTGWKRLLHRLRNRSKKSKAKAKLPSVQINVNHNIHYTSEIHNIFNMYIYI